MPLFRKSKKEPPPDDGGKRPSGADVASLVQQAIDHLRAGRWKAAIGPLEEALAADPSKPAFHGELAQAYAKIGDGEAACRHFEAFRKADPNRAEDLAEQFRWFAAGSEVKPLGTAQRGQNTYESYACADLTKAQEFLEAKEVDRPLYYVDVETPDGIWGADIDGIYQGRLPDWKKDLDLADCDGVAVSVVPIGGFEYCAKGISDNFIVTVGCGRCSHEWPGALRYQDTTIARCPSCGAYNKISSAQYHAVLREDG